MKLGEARQKLSLMWREVEELSKLLSEVPVLLLPSLLEKCNVTLQEAQELDKSIKTTLRHNDSEKSHLNVVENALVIINLKLSILEKLESRKDISEEQKENLFKDIIKIRATRDELELRVSKLLWEIDVLE